MSIDSLLTPLILISMNSDEGMQVCQNCGLERIDKTKQCAHCHFSIEQRVPRH